MFNEKWFKGLIVFLFGFLLWGSAGCGDPDRDTIEETKASLKIIKRGPFGTGLEIIDSSNAGSELEGSYKSKDGTDVTFKGKRDQDVSTSNASIGALMPFMQEQLNSVILDRENQRQAFLAFQKQFGADLQAMADKIVPAIVKMREIAATEPEAQGPLDQLLQVKELIDTAKSALPK